VLDGLEVIQSSDRDNFGRLQNADARIFLELMLSAEPSLVLITTRLPLLDVMTASSYLELAIDGLDVNEGQELLALSGVHGSAAAQRNLVSQWQGHPLALQLLAGLARREYGGDIAAVTGVPIKVGDPTYKRIRTLMESYDARLSNAETQILIVLSAFRTAVTRETLEEALVEVERFEPTVPAVTNDSLSKVLDLVVGAAIVSKSTEGLGMHPLIRAHYESVRGERWEAVRTANLHRALSAVYLRGASALSDHPSLAELSPLIEAAHHAAMAGDYDQAFNIIHWRIEGERLHRLTYEFGAYDLNRRLLVDLFPNADTSAEPLVTLRTNKAYVLSSFGICEAATGRLSGAEVYFRRSLAIDLEDGDEGRAGIVLTSLSKLCLLLGRFDEAETMASESLRLFRKVGDTRQLPSPLEGLAWLSFVRGDADTALTLLSEVEGLVDQLAPETQAEPAVQHYRTYGILTRANIKLRLNMVDDAYQLAPLGLSLAEKTGVIIDVASAHSIIGSVLSTRGEHAEASRHFDEGVSSGSKTSQIDLLIVVLMRRGRWASRFGPRSRALPDLLAALELCTAGGIRVYEADVRIGLAWHHLREGDPEHARREVGAALAICEEIGYHWGLLDAREVLNAVTESSH
jgi:tetratricopeptide (TPR) repeat protein